VLRGNSSDSAERVRVRETATIIASQDVDVAVIAGVAKQSGRPRVGFATPLAKRQTRSRLRLWRASQNKTANTYVIEITL
jgi:hypothetical protein